MRTTFLCTAALSSVLCACSHALPSLRSALPAPPDSAATGTAGREWALVRIDGPYGAFDMRVPAFTISPAQGTTGSLLVDSVALRQVERRLTARFARVARDEAASLIADTTPSVATKHPPAPLIQPGLLGSIQFGGDSIELSSDARVRIAAVAKLALQLEQPITLITSAAAAGPAVLDAAMMRARFVYLALLQAQPALAGREVLVNVRLRPLPPGADAPAATVEVYSRPLQ